MGGGWVGGGGGWRGCCVTEGSAVAVGRACDTSWSTISKGSEASLSGWDGAISVNINVIKTNPLS